MLDKQISQKLIDYIKKYNNQARKYNEENKAKGNWKSLMVEDVDYWVECGIFNLKDLVRNNLIDYILSEYKSVHGIKPRFMDFYKMSIKQLRREVNYLIEEIKKTNNNLIKEIVKSKWNE